LQQGAERRRDRTEVKGDNAVPVIEAPGDAVDPVGLGIISVIAYFMEYVGKDEQTAGKADCKAEKVDEGDEFIFPQIPERDFQVIS